MSNYKAEYWSAGVLERWEIALSRAMFVARRSKGCAPSHIQASPRHRITPSLHYSSTPFFS
jgi:hypothetical protein